MLREHKGSFKSRTGHAKVKVVTEGATPTANSEGILDRFSF